MRKGGLDFQEKQDLSTCNELATNLQRNFGDSIEKRTNLQRGCNEVATCVFLVLFWFLLIKLGFRCAIARLSENCTFHNGLFAALPVQVL